MTEKEKQPLFDFLKNRFNLEEDKADETAIIDSLKKNIEFKGTNLWTLIFAILIASVGLNVNSPATIIGAMLISPLMGPIMGIGLGLGIFDFVLIKNAFKNLLVAVTISLITSTVYFFLTPLQEARSELLARTTPTIWDVSIALFGGLAGIIASTRKNLSNVIPGVAIATALMPPLCTAGYGLGTGNFYFFAGAFYLFLINCVFISLSTFLIVRFLKFKPALFVDKKTEAKVRKYIWFITTLTIIPSIYLAYKFVGQEIFKQKAQQYIANEIKDKNLLVMDKTIDVFAQKITLVVYGEDLNDSSFYYITKGKEKYGLEEADVQIKQTLNRHTSQTSDTKSIETIEMERRLFEKDAKIKELITNLKTEQIQALDSSIYKEFISLFGYPKELVISKAQVRGEDKKLDTLTLVYYKASGKTSHLNKKQMESWLKERTKSKNLKVIND